MGPPLPLRDGCCGLRSQWRHRGRRGRAHLRTPAAHRQLPSPGWSRGGSLSPGGAVACGFGAGFLKALWAWGWGCGEGEAGGVPSELLMHPPGCWLQTQHYHEPPAPWCGEWGRRCLPFRKLVPNSRRQERTFLPWPLSRNRWPLCMSAPCWAHGSPSGLRPRAAHPGPGLFGVSQASPSDSGRCWALGIGGAS